MTRAARICSSCGTLNKPTWEFCARCGEPLEAVTPAAQASAAVSSRSAVDDEVAFPWRATLMLAAAAVVIAAAFSVRRAGIPSLAPVLAVPVVAGVPAQAPPSLSPARASLIEGRGHLNAGDMPGALDALARAAAALPEDPGAQHAYGQALWAAGQKESALARFRMAANLGAHDASYPLDLARTLIDLGQQGDAQQILEETAGAHPDDPRVLQQLGHLYVSRGESDRALPLLRHAAELRKDDPRATAQLGVALEKTGARGEAIPLFQTAVEQLPNSPTMRTLLADALLKEGRKDEAMEVVEAGLKRAPNAPLLYRTRALLLERSGEAGSAAQAYREYLRLVPDAPDAEDLAARAASLEKRAGGSPSPS